VSAFVGLERTVPATEARRKMDAAEAALYPQVKREDARRLWLLWEQQATPPPPPSTLGQTDRIRLTFNGARVSKDELKQQLGRALGRGLTA
jgi:hypothetical protein